MGNGISSGSSNIEAQIRRLSKKFKKLSVEGQYGYNYVHPSQSPAFYPSFNEEHTTGLQNFPSALTYREFYPQYSSFQRLLLELEEPGNEELNYFDYYNNSTSSSWIPGSGMPENQQMVQPYGLFAPSTSITGSGMPENQQMVQPYLFAPSISIPGSGMPENQQMVQPYLFAPSTSIPDSGMPENQQMVQPYLFAPSNSIPGSGMPENQQMVQPYLFAPSNWIMPAENEQMVQPYGPVTHNLIQQVADEAPPKRRRVGGYNFGEGPSTQLEPQPAIEELNLELKLYVGEVDLALKL